MADCEKFIQHRRELHRKHQLKYRLARRKRCQPSVQITLNSNKVVSMSDSECEDIQDDENGDPEENLSVSSEYSNGFDSSEEKAAADEPVLQSSDVHVADQFESIDEGGSSCSFGETNKYIKRIHDNSICIANFIRKANLNHRNTNDLLQLLQNIHFDEEIPITENDLWKSLDVEFDFRTYIFCTSCLSKLVKFSDNCKCNPSIKKINSELIIFSVSKEIKDTIKKNIALIDWYRHEPNQIMCDIVQGSLYKKKRRNNLITLLISTDGKPTVKSSASSMWPVLGTIVEIPPPVREFQENIMLLALWHSPSSPHADILITDVINQVISLQNNGLYVDLGFNGIHKFEVDVQLVVADLPGRAKITCLNGHSGYYACGNCLMEGIRCFRHRHILYTWSDYSQLEPDLRTQHHVDACASRAKLSGKTLYGVHGPSPLSQIISIPDQCVYDYFHLIFEGHMIMLLKEWKLLLKNISIGYIDDFLNGIDYPHDFHRKPKGFNSFNQWKASDLRTFFLYLALPLIIRLQPALSNRHIYHFSLILVYVRKLRHFHDRREIGHMQSFIHEYLNMFSSIYGNCRELLSVHALVHLRDQCIRHGALSYHSMFPFESQLNYLRKLAHGTNSLAQQVAFWYTVDKRLNMTNKYTIDLLTKQQLQCDRFFDKDILIRFQSKFRNALYLFSGQHTDASLEYASRLQFGVQLYHSLAYSRKKKTTSYRICVQNVRCIRKICCGEIVFFFSRYGENVFLLKLHKCSYRDFSSLISYEHCVQSWPDYINQYFLIVERFVFDFVVLPCSAIINKCLFIPFSERYFICTEIEHISEHD